MLLFNPGDDQGPEFVRGMERMLSLAADMERIQRGVRPEAMAGNEVPILDRWVLTKRPAPCLAGLSTGHPKLVGENRAIGTSDLWIISVDFEWARTLSRWYRLGRPASQFGRDA
ncbi:DUF6634 family protein [Aminobacter carboxidus]|uniref:Uncharacterized protein n=1 Tax=Aminobacter carboxidus TaxID=376165 RepID=A0ABR9GJ47_9HYPH|nr:DUF6634 family protein [Aminobacter carboxidus]MBE1203697.1 hypothetical protein [Aminobacter carboxidus]